MRAAAAERTRRLLIGSAARLAESNCVFKWRSLAAWILTSYFPRLTQLGTNKQTPEQSPWVGQWGSRSLVNTRRRRCDVRLDLLHFWRCGVGLKRFLNGSLNEWSAPPTGSRWYMRLLLSGVTVSPAVDLIFNRNTWTRLSPDNAVLFIFFIFIILCVNLCLFK